MSSNQVKCEKRSLILKYTVSCSSENVSGSTANTFLFIVVCLAGLGSLEHSSYFLKNKIDTIVFFSFELLQKLFRRSTRCRKVEDRMWAADQQLHPEDKSSFLYDKRKKKYFYKMCLGLHHVFYLRICSPV